MTSVWDQVFVATRILLAADGRRMHRSDLWEMVAAQLPTDGDNTRRDARGRPPGFVSWSYISADLSRAEWLLAIDGNWILTRAGQAELPEIESAEELKRRALAHTEQVRELESKTADVVTFPSAVIAPPRPDLLVRQVSSDILRLGLGGEPSALDPSINAWSAETADKLYAAYNLRVDTSADSFMVKLRRQFSDLSDDGLVLAAELMMLHALPLSNLTSITKQDRLAKVLSWMDRPVAIPRQVRAAFTQSSWNGGQGANTLAWRWLAEAVEIVRAWWHIPEQERRQILGDPWLWRDFVNSQDAMPSLKESWHYLLHPNHFLPIVNVNHKAQIRSAFSARIGGVSEDSDRDLFAIAIALQNDAGAPVDFYRSPYEEQWKPAVPAERRAWLIRPPSKASSRLDDWLDGGYASLDAEHFGPLPADSSELSIRETVERNYQHEDYVHRLALGNEFTAFVNRMRTDDVIAFLNGSALAVGVVTSNAESTTDAKELVRSVDWAEERRPVTGLAAELTADLEQQGRLVDITRSLHLLTGLLPQSDTPDSEAAEELVQPLEHPELSEATDELEGQLHLDRSWIQRLIDLLQDRQQVILYGPPGTGKSYLAQHLARHLTRPDAVKLVQFHPSYAYEDFVEGFRPVAASGDRVGFALTAGPLRRIAALANDEPTVPFFLIIDEINRANLAKVFGELYFLLEYRDSAINLQYSPAESFSLPRNLFVIGTMNTADRSIALVDAAIRRRFAFVEMHPEVEPVKSLLRRWLIAEAKPDDRRVDLLEALNAAIHPEDRDMQIGPSYLMKSDVDRPGGLERVWTYSILPLLEEHYYGRYSRAELEERFGLSALQKSLDSAPEVAEQ